MQSRDQKNKTLYQKRDVSFYKKDLRNIDSFRRSDFRIALQKKGELTQLSKTIISDFFNATFPRVKSTDRRMFKNLGSKKIGVFFAKNNDLCYLVDIGLVDVAIVGTDSIVQYGKDSGIKIIKDLRNLAKWPLVLATPFGSHIHRLSDIGTIATQYPRLTQQVLKEVGLKKAKILPVNGSSEGMVHLSGEIDAVVDILVTGRTLRENGLIAWEPPLAYINPVVIANTNSLKDTNKKQYFDLIRAS